jgi:glutamate formiminotransferase/formiminotetrahydrofolate cyclodeaminase
MKQIIECVPNVSEGRNRAVIEELAEVIRKVDGVKLLHTDIGESANRTVYTFVGNPAKVTEAAFQLIKRAGQLIDMQTHKGIHPRIGAVDVCPLIPVACISMEDTVRYAETLAIKVGSELQVPVFCYGFSAKEQKRIQLENIRREEYEGLKKKLTQQEWRPDYGPSAFIPKFGAVAIGARNYLIAFNVNLDTKNVDIAKEIASEIRESGRVVRSILGNKRKIQRIHRKLKDVKAIGWYAGEYECAQVSTNIINYNTTSIFKVFQTIVECARSKSINVTGSEIIGLVPLMSLVADMNFTSTGIETILKEVTTKSLATVQRTLKLQIKEKGELKSKILEFYLNTLYF